jgi:hypothetical protein
MVISTSSNALAMQLLCLQIVWHTAYTASADIAIMSTSTKYRGMVSTPTTKHTSVYERRVALLRATPSGYRLVLIQQRRPTSWRHGNKGGLNMFSAKYLGDGLYASFDGYQFCLRAPRDGGDHVVFLEPPVLAAFDAYRKAAMEGTRHEPIAETTCRE